MKSTSPTPTTGTGEEKGEACAAKLSSIDADQNAGRPTDASSTYYSGRSSPTSPGSGRGSFVLGGIELNQEIQRQQEEAAGKMDSTKHRSTIRTILFDEAMGKGGSFRGGHMAKKSRLADCKSKIASVLDSRTYNVFIACVVIIVLFAEEFTTAAFYFIVDIFTGLVFIFTAAFVIFALEVMFSGLAVPGYFNSFYFWLDILATLSLVPDQPWFPASFRDTSGSAGETLNLLRLVRVTRMVRLVRVVRLMKAFKSLRGNEEEDNPAAAKEPTTKLGNVSITRTTLYH